MTPRRKLGMENMTNKQFDGIIRMIIALLKKRVDYDEIIGYLDALISEG